MAQLYTHLMGCGLAGGCGRQGVLCCGSSCHALKLSIVVAELLLQVAPRVLSATADVPRPAHLAPATRRAPVQLLLHKYLLTEAGAEVLVRGHTQGFAFTFL